MTVWLLFGVDYIKGIAVDTVLGVFESKEALMEYREMMGVDSDYDNIEYGQYPIKTQEETLANH